MIFAHYRSAFTGILATVVFVLGALIVTHSEFVCAQSRTGGEACGNHAHGNGTKDTNNNNANTPPPPQSCDLQLSATVLQNGPVTVQLSWSPTPNGYVSLTRLHNNGRGGQAITLPANANGASDTFTVVAPQAVTYTLSYSIPNARGQQQQYQCTKAIETVTTLTECNDNIDNGDSEDGLADELDPGCHTDGNPNNSGSYVGQGGSESNPNPDLVASIGATVATNAVRRVNVTSTVQNQSGTFAQTNTYVYGWRNIDATAEVPKCGNNGSQCFTHNGYNYRIIRQRNSTFTANEARTEQGNFTPSLPGRYQVCTVADLGDVIDEKSETNNASCLTVKVDATNGNVTTIIYTPPSIDADPGRVRNGNPTQLTWDLGGRMDCVVTGSNGEVIPTQTNSSQQSKVLTAETTYTLSCAEDGATDAVTIKLLPQLQEL